MLRKRRHLFILSRARGRQRIVHIPDDVLHPLWPYFGRHHQPCRPIFLQHQFPLLLLQRRNEIVQRLFTHRALCNTYSASVFGASVGNRGRQETLFFVVVFDEFASEIGDELRMAVEPRLVELPGIADCLF